MPQSPAHIIRLRRDIKKPALFLRAPAAAAKDQERSPDLAALVRVG